MGTQQNRAYLSTHLISCTELAVFFYLHFCMTVVHDTQTSFSLRTIKHCSHTYIMTAHVTTVLFSYLKCTHDPHGWESFYCKLQIIRILALLHHHRPNHANLFFVCFWSPDTFPFSSCVIVMNVSILMLERSFLFFAGCRYVRKYQIIGTLGTLNDVSLNVHWICMYKDW